MRGEQMCFKKFIVVVFVLKCLCLCAGGATAAEVVLPDDWKTLEPIVVSRIHQENPKMKLSQKQGNSFAHFLKDLPGSTHQLKKLKDILPKTTVELLRSVQERGVPIKEAEKMAAYLEKLVAWFKFKDIAAFDENTSHIIGREWYEIDYTGENMTWQNQKIKYAPAGILNFKSLAMLKKFFPVEAKLPYFRQSYLPQNTTEFKIDSIKE